MSEFEDNFNKAASLISEATSLLKQAKELAYNEGYSLSEVDNEAWRELLGLLNVDDYNNVNWSNSLGYQC